MCLNGAIRTARIRAGLKQQEVADRLGIERSSYARYEGGSREPDMGTLNRLAAILNVSTDFLLGVTSNPTPVTEDDAEIWELREQLRRRPGMRILFSATKDASEEDLLKTVKILEALKGDKDDAN